MGTEYTPKSWITSDLHFSHKNIMKFCPRTRTFNDIDEMDQALIKEFATKVHPYDTLYILGDVSFGNATRTRAILSQIPGKKILVYGNHDQVIRDNLDIQRMFESVHEYLEVMHEGTLIAMFHYPVHEWNRMHRGSLHAHGHIHDIESGVGGKIVNVCWDKHGRILELDELFQMTKHKPVRSHHGD